ncbi:hypothetical protein ABB37_08319 [Leptomonas pyrrhocoris]|uniref:Uncharacterized protein n=1 Tax=Leptomonas pyrrhocoris TaxID=157538 RepID=A0A0N1J4E4_LEPPY|nr:hypothetical protein ABB37_08319 [Leptomonas pyrrhocoris]KPA75794.1 hypothetical protein ABB37_08319 [Leptomonas pyrrhocoris]|eukprot:XP_015654233.1 hypothetical protein ABB37_08319 [Leptomonas pyrrhocoris]
MEDAATPLLSYSAWRVEAARIGELAQRIPKDENLASLQRAVMSRANAATTAASPEPAAATSSSFFSQLFSSSGSSIAGTAAASPPTAMPWCASLAQLLALAELPPPNSVAQPPAVGSVASDAARGASSSSSSPSSGFSVQRRFAQVVSAVANQRSSSSGNDNNISVRADRGDASVEGHSHVSSSHAVLPMRMSPFPSSEDRQQSRLRVDGNDATATATTTARTPPYEDRDDADEEGGFDRMFARLRQQAAERSHPLPSPPHNWRVAPAAQKYSALFSSFSSSTSGRKSGGAANGLSPSCAGLTAARVALDAADLLLLRVRQQNQLSTVPSGRVAEAETLVLRATVGREAQLYAESIEETIHALLQRHEHAREQGEAAGGVPDQRASVVDDDKAPYPHPWADRVMSASPESLRRLVRDEFVCAAPWTQLLASSSSTASPPHNPSFGCCGSSNSSLHGAGGASGLHACAFPPTTAGQGNGRLPTAAGNTRVSPTSASAASFYHAPRSPSSAAAAAASASSDSATSNARNPQQQQHHLHFFSADVVTALHRWKQLVDVQQRALRCAEAQDYVAAAHLFVGAAAERVQFGCSREDANADTTDTTTAEKWNVRSPAADLAVHGVTHLLRACGLLLSDRLMEQEVVYPARFLKEMEEMCTTVESTTPTAAPPLLLPPLLATPHAPRVWVLLAQFATYVERYRLFFPWDVAEASSTLTSMPPVAHHAAASTSTLQMLWEVSTAVLLFQPADAIRVMQAALSGTLQDPKAASPPPCVSLHELFHAYTRRPTTTAPPPPPLLAQSGTLPLCLFSLRRASASAVRARHYAEALRDAQIALYLLHTPPSATAADVVTHEAAVDYCKVSHWRVAAPLSSAAQGDEATTTTFVSSSACVSTLVNYDARLHFLLLRVLLLLAATPLTAGAATAQMLKEGELSSNAHAPAKAQNEVRSPTRRSSPTVVDGSLAIHAFESADDVAALEKQQANVFLKVAPDAPLGRRVSTPVPPQTDSEGAPRKDAHGAAAPPRCTSAASADIAATLRRTLAALQAMTDELCAVEQEGLVVCERAGAAANSEATAYLPPYVPKVEYRLSTVLRRAAAAAASPQSANAAVSPSPHPSASTDRTDGGSEANLRGSPPETSDAATGVRRQCGATSSARYQQLKRKHQAAQRRPSPQKEEASANESTPRADGGGAEATAGASPTGVDDGVTSPAQHAPPQNADGIERTGLVDVAATAQGEARLHDASEETGGVAEDAASSSVVAPSSSALMRQLQHLVCELLTIVCLLTLPLRAKSTCTVTQETALPAPQNGAADDTSIAEESGYDTAYTQARMALRTFAGRLERCLRQLGARDRTLFTLLRRLQVELLFPAVCGPPL